MSNSNFCSFNNTNTSTTNLSQRNVHTHTHTPQAPSSVDHHQAQRAPQPVHETPAHDQSRASTNAASNHVKCLLFTTTPSQPPHLIIPQLHHAACWCRRAWIVVERGSDGHPITHEAGECSTTNNSQKKAPHTHTPSPTHSLTHSFTHSLTPSLTHSLTPSLAHKQTESCARPV